MFCLLNIDHYVIPNDIVVKLSKIYRYIGNNEVAKDIMDRNLTFEQYIEELDIKIQELS